jgi:hypothetical protein
MTYLLGKCSDVRADSVLRFGRVLVLNTPPARSGLKYIELSGNIMRPSGSVATAWYAAIIFAFFATVIVLVRTAMRPGTVCQGRRHRSETGGAKE